MFTSVEKHSDYKNKQKKKKFYMMEEFKRIRVLDCCIGKAQAAIVRALLHPLNVNTVKTLYNELLCNKVFFIAM